VDDLFGIDSPGGGGFCSCGNPNPNEVGEGAKVGRLVYVRFKKPTGILELSHQSDRWWVRTRGRVKGTSLESRVLTFTQRPTPLVPLSLSLSVSLSSLDDKANKLPLCASLQKGHHDFLPPFAPLGASAFDASTCSISFILNKKYTCVYT
jgi:hypothetical protein